MEDLQQLTIERDKHIQYINVEHDANLDKLCNQEGIDFMKARMTYDSKVQQANDQYEQTLVEIHNTFPSSQDRRRQVKEQLATHERDRKIDTAKEEYDIERARIRNRTVRLREIERLELKLAKKYLNEVNEKINKTLTSKSPITM